MEPEPYRVPCGPRSTSAWLRSKRSASMTVRPLSATARRTMASRRGRSPRSRRCRRAADRPRISYSVWPGPAVRIEMPGTLVTISSTVVMFSCLKSSLVSAVMLIGVACTVDSRFSAVTTISSNSAPPLAAGAGVAGFAGPAGSAIAEPQRRAVPNRAERIDEVRHAAVSAAHNAFFIFFSLDQHIERPRRANAPKRMRPRWWRTLASRPRLLAIPL